MPSITDAIRHGQREIRRQEGVTFARLLGEYDQLWWYVERIIRRYESQVAEAIELGQEVNPAWLRRQVWYRQLQESIDVELARFNHTALRTLQASQVSAVGIASESATMFAGTVNINPGIVARVNAPAFERWVSALRPDSPLRGVLDRFDARVSSAIERHLTDGIGSGEGVNTIVRRITRDIGPDAQAGRLQTIVRTEQMRAYRGSWKDQMDGLPRGMISSYRWTASLSTRTCPACIAMHGRIFREYPDRFHVSCRCVVTPVVSPQYAPPRQFGPTGPEWFDQLEESKQRQILPPAHFELYQAGVPITDMVMVKRNRTWGSSVQVKPASALRGE